MSLVHASWTSSLTPGMILTLVYFKLTLRSPEALRGPEAMYNGKTLAIHYQTLETGDCNQSDRLAHGSL